MDKRDIAKIRRQLRREHADSQRDADRPRKRQSVLQRWRDRRIVPAEGPPPGTWIFPPEDPMVEHMTAHVGHPVYIPVSAVIRAMFALNRIFGGRAPRPVRMAERPTDGGTAGEPASRRPPPHGGGPTGVREPRRPRPTAPQAGAAPLPTDDE